MIEFHNIFVVQVLLICLMLVGVVTTKIGIVGDQARSSLTDLILYVFLPANILSSFLGTDRSQLPSLGMMLIISLGIMILSFTLALLLYKRVGSAQKKVLIYATLISNASFLGNPVVESIYGIEALPYVAAYLVPLRVALWTVGLMIFTGSKGNLKKVFLHPCIVATYLGLLVMFTGFVPPVLISRLLFTLGSCTIPVSMMVVGGILATVDTKKVLTKLTVYYTVIRLAIIPLLVMGILLALRPDPMVAGISVLLSAMPAGATTPILAEKYGADRELASKIVFVSTLLSIISAPLLAWLLGRVF